MPYTDWNYTNPGWTNNNPPAINADNLNEISNTMEKFFYHWWKRGTQVIEEIELPTTRNILIESQISGSTASFAIYETIEYNTEEEKFEYSNPTTITTQQGTLAAYAGYYVYPSNNNTTLAYKISNSSTVRIGSSTSVYDVTVIAANIYVNDIDVVYSKTKDFPDYGQQGDYFYDYLGIPIENAVEKSTIIQYIGTGSSNLQIDIGKQFNAVMWANCKNESIIYGLGNIPAIIYQANKLVRQGPSYNMYAQDDYTINGTIVNIKFNDSSLQTNTAGTIYYLLVI